MSTNLEALDWLGKGLDMTNLTPFDISSAKLLVKPKTIINIQDDTETRTVTIDNVKYKIPSVVNVNNAGTPQNLTVSYKSGSEALRGFEGTDPARTSRLAVYADPASYPLRKALPDQYQFYFFNFNVDVYSASVVGYTDYIGDPTLVERITQLPKPFANRPDVIDAYKTFFEEYGSHVLTSVSFGAHCNMTAWASNNYSDVNSNWARDVTAFVQGINNSGKFDKDVLSEPQYQKFRSLVQLVMSIRGGDPALANKLMQGPYDYDTFTQWANTWTQKRDLVFMKATEIWYILRDADEKALRDGARALEDAFKYIANQSQPQTALVILESKSNAAELGILTPSASVSVGGPLPAFDPTTQNIIGLSETKVHWGNQVKAQKVVIPFYITNDGGPVDIYLRDDAGETQATIGGITYRLENKAGSKNWFYQIPLTAARTSEKHMGGRRW